MLKPKKEAANELKKKEKKEKKRRRKPMPVLKFDNYERYKRT